MLEAQDRARRRGQERRAVRAGLHQRSLQRVLSAGRRLARHPRARARAPRAALAALAARARAPAADGTLRGRSPRTWTRRRRRSSASRRATATPGAAVRALGARRASRSWMRCCRPFPPLRAGARLAVALGPRRAAALRPLRAAAGAARWPRSSSDGDGRGWLLAGNALHADLAPESAGSGLFGWVLCGLGQQLGCPVPEGGAGRLTDALVRPPRRPTAAELECGARGGARAWSAAARAVGVRTADGREITARRAVLADVRAPTLFLDLVGAQHLPARLRRRPRPLRARRRDGQGRLGARRRRSRGRRPTRAAPAPSTSPRARRAHAHASQLARGLIPDRPFLLIGQYSMADDTRQPAGTRDRLGVHARAAAVRGDAGGDADGRWDEPRPSVRERMEAEVERRAPGFRDADPRAATCSRRRARGGERQPVGGAVNGGTAQLHQQLVFRPAPGLGPPRDAGRAALPGRRLGAPGRRRPRRAPARTRRARRCGRRAARTAAVARASVAKLSLEMHLPVMPPVADAGQVHARDPGRSVYEPKWDGFRSIVFRDGDEVEIGSRNEQPMTRYFPEVVEAVTANLPAALRRRRRDRRRRRGRTRLDFEALQQRHPPGGQPGRACSPSRPRRASSRSTCSPSATTTSPARPFAERRARARGGARRRRPPVHLTPTTDDRDARPAVVRALRGRRPRRRHRQAARRRRTSRTSG